jgi:hypothetical protein
MPKLVSESPSVSRKSALNPSRIRSTITARCDFRIHAASTRQDESCQTQIILLCFAKHLGPAVARSLQVPFDRRSVAVQVDHMHMLQNVQAHSGCGHPHFRHETGCGKPHLFARSCRHLHEAIGFSEKTTGVIELPIQAYTDAGSIVQRPIVEARPNKHFQGLRKCRYRRHHPLLRLVEGDFRTA